MASIGEFLRQRLEIKNAQDNLKKHGYSFIKRYYTDSKLIKAQKISMNLSDSYFYIYTYIYPEYEINKKTTVDKVKGEGGEGYYEDSLDEVLGGDKQTLGG